MTRRAPLLFSCLLSTAISSLNIALYWQQQHPFSLFCAGATAGTAFASAVAAVFA